MLNAPCKNCKGGKLTHGLCKDRCSRYKDFKTDRIGFKKFMKEAVLDINSATKIQQLKLRR